MDMDYFLCAWCVANCQLATHHAVVIFIERQLYAVCFNFKRPFSTQDIYIYIYYFDSHHDKH
jgi:hypothetical protein